MGFSSGQPLLLEETQAQGCWHQGPAGLFTSKEGVCKVGVRLQMMQNEDPSKPSYWSQARVLLPDTPSPHPSPRL